MSARQQVVVGKPPRGGRSRGGASGAGGRGGRPRRNISGSSSNYGSGGTPARTRFSEDNLHSDDSYQRPRFAVPEEAVPYETDDDSESVRSEGTDVGQEDIGSSFTAAYTSGLVEHGDSSTEFKLIEDSTHLLITGPAKYEGTTKQQRIQRSLAMPPNHWPKEYTEKTADETVLFHIVDNFRRQYEQLYARRPKLMLCPPNEAGAEKFVCTSLKPMALPYDELFDWKEAAAFVADYIAYEPLDPPTSLPEHLPSPSTILEWQIGDCLDMATLLCSLLLGVGYDAYVVVGYATKEVTLNDQTLVHCPELVEEDRIRAEIAARPPPEKPKPKFTKPRRGKFQSRYKETLIEKKAKALEDEAAAKAAEEAAFEAAREAELRVDALRGRRVHVWVMVQEGHRDVDTAFFIEPTTGFKKGLDDSEYLGVECVWSDKNYWVNVQDPRPAGGVADLNFELHRVDSWEYVFVAATGEESEEDDDGGLHSLVNKSASQMFTETAEGEEVFPLPPAWVDQISLPRLHFERRYPNGRKRIEYKHCTVELFAPYSRKDGLTKRITIYSAAGMKLVNEVRCEFANRSDLLTKQVFYFDNALVRKTMSERELSYHDPSDPIEAFVEEFALGRPMGLTRLLVRGHNVCRIAHLRERQAKRLRRSPREYHMEFNPLGRSVHDGMTKRVLFMDHRMVELFEGRADRLNFRSVEFSTAFYSQVDAVTPTDDCRTKMVEHYTRDGSIPADADVSKRTYLATLQQIEEVYHAADAAIRATKIVYASATADNARAKPGDDDPPESFSYSAALADARRDGLDRKEVYARFYAAVGAQTECTEALTKSGEELVDILDRREKERESCDLVLSVYDTERRSKRRKPGMSEAATARSVVVEKPSDFADVVMDAVRKAEAGEMGDPVAGMNNELDPTDMLTYFINDELAGKLPSTYEEAEKVKTACLKYFKTRIVAKATIIHDKLQATMDRIKSMEEDMARNAEHVQADDMEMYELETQKLKFQINVRLRRQEQLHNNCMEEFARLDAELSAHPLLADVLRAGPGGQARQVRGKGKREL